MRVRERLSVDVDELVEVAARVRAEDGYPLYLAGGNFRRFLTRPTPLSAWVAEMGGRVVGHVALNAESTPSVMRVVRDAGVGGEIAFVARLLVDPRARRRGLGALLLDHARSEAVAHGRSPVLDVVASASSALALYRGRGWREIGRTTFELPDGRPIEQIVFAGPH